MTPTTTYLTETDIRNVKAAVDIVQVVGEYVHLRKAGRDWQGLCPFHTEKTPSFVVHGDDKQFFRCFGCSASGDVLTFLRKIEGGGFRETVAKLAERYGIPLTGRALTKDQARHARDLAQECAWFWEHEQARLQAIASDCYRCQQQAERFVIGDPPDSPKVEWAWWWMIHGTDLGDIAAAEADRIRDTPPRHLMEAYLQTKRANPAWAAGLRREMISRAVFDRALAKAMREASPEEFRSTLTAIGEALPI